MNTREIPHWICKRTGQESDAQPVPGTNARVA